MKSAITHLWSSLRDLATAVTYITGINCRIFMYTVLSRVRLVCRYRPLVLWAVFLHRHTTIIYNTRSKVLRSIYIIKHRYQRWSIYDS